MLNFLKKLFGFGNKEVIEVPYKVETPQVVDTFTAPEPAAITPIPLVVDEVNPVEVKIEPAKPAAITATKAKAPSKPKTEKATKPKESKAKPAKKPKMTIVK